MFTSPQRIYYHSAFGGFTLYWLLPKRGYMHLSGQALARSDAMKHQQPQVGIFIKPVGNYGYCLQAAKITTYDTGQQISWKRFGLKDNQPFNDGDNQGFFYLHLVNVTSNAWKEEAHNGYPAVYYKALKIAQPATGQQQLF